MKSINLLRRILLYLFFTAFCVSAIFSQDTKGKPLISVLDFKISGISKSEVEVFIDYVTSHIVETGEYRVIDRMQRQALLREMEFSASDCTDESCQLEIGKMLSANQIIVGSIGKVGSRFILNIKLIEVETGETLKTGSEKYNSIDDLIDDSKRLTYAFVGKKITTREKEVKKPVKKEEPAKPVIKSAAAEPSGRKGGAFEIMAGMGDDIGDTVTTSSVGYVYQFSNSFSLGAWLGIFIIMDYEEILPIGGLKLVFGNKVDKMALAINLGFPPGLGIYIKNLFANLWYYDGAYGAEIGYSFYFGK